MMILPDTFSKFGDIIYLFKMSVYGFKSNTYQAMAIFIKMFLEHQLSVICI